MLRPILANSVPKAGTHLLKRCLELLPGVSAAGVHVDISEAAEDVRERLAAMPAGRVATGHLVHRGDYVALLRELPHVHCLMLRDPRDVALSLAEYIPRIETHYLHAEFQRLSPSERLMACIVGRAEPRPPWDDVALRDMSAAFRQFTDWLVEPGVLHVRFEDLVGPSGGGMADQQRRAVTQIAAHVGVPLSGADAARVAQGVFDRASPTFREGAIGGWRASYGPAHVRAVKDVAGGLLVELGYERGQDW